MLLLLTSKGRIQDAKSRQFRLHVLLGAALVFSLMLSSSGSVAQQAPDMSGSPSATTTIDGKQLPAPPPQFGGVINQSAANSKPWAGTTSGRRASVFSCCS